MLMYGWNPPSSEQALSMKKLYHQTGHTRYQQCGSGRFFTWHNSAIDNRRGGYRCLRPSCNAHTFDKEEWILFVPQPADVCMRNSTMSNKDFKAKHPKQFDIPVHWLDTVKFSTS